MCVPVFRFHAKQRDFCLFQSVQTVSASHPAPHSMGNGRHSNIIFDRLILAASTNASYQRKSSFVIETHLFMKRNKVTKCVFIYIYTSGT
jgi:hypothetical protein